MSRHHISTQFDAELEAIRTSMLHMGGLVEEQMRDALAGFETRDTAMLESVEVKEREVNLLEIDLDDRCTHVIARRQPAAGDLRLVMAVFKTITDLERIGDESVKIARAAQRIQARTSTAPSGFSGMRVAGNIAGGMLNDALNAFARIDPDAGGKIVLQDAQMDEEFRRLLRELVTFMLEDPTTISTCLDIIWIGKALERIGDHAKNIAQYVIYIAQGVDVRHRKSLGGAQPN
ncbi:MAG: phosphate signaling complex protein PhoU [Betaproteobacteria bacterium]|nr:phosphate signaling complex protein PhoU [Betaproteobacteria bacterium]